MWPFPNPFDLFGDVVNDVAGWAWDKVVQGIYTWFANGLLLLMEWVWGVLDTATTPRLSEAWFATGMVRPLAAISLAITIAMMLGSAIQAGFGGRPELIVDALKEGPKSIIAAALSVTVMDVLVRGADVLSDVAWQAGRGDALKVMDGLAATMVASGGLATTFLGPLSLLFGMIGLLVTTVVLFMRSSLLYLVAAFAPIVWSSSVSPVMRGSGRRLVHVTVALVLAKPAISITLVVGVKLLANATTPAPGGASGAAALGTLVSGFACFAIAGLSPWVIFRLLPSVESASVSSGIVGGWGRAGMTAVNAGLMVKSLGASAAMSAATRSLPQFGSSSQPGAVSLAGNGAGAGSARGAASSTGGGGGSSTSEPAARSSAPRSAASAPDALPSSAATPAPRKSAPAEPAPSASEAPPPTSSATTRGRPSPSAESVGEATTTDPSARAERPGGPPRDSGGEGGAS